MDYKKIVVVTRKTRLEGMIQRFHTANQALFYVEHSGGNFDFYVAEHDTYYEALDRLEKQLSLLGKLHIIERSFLPNYIFTEHDLVVTIGIDGQVVNTAKYLNGQPIVAVNPDPEHIDGILLPFTVDSAIPAVERCLAGKARFQQITMAKAALNDGQELYAFNDLFIGRPDHVSARYNIRFGGAAEDHSSSGVIVSTGVGGSGWFSSFFNMVNGFLDEFSPPDHPDLHRPAVPWDADKLYFVVREPFISKTSSAGVVAGVISPANPLVLESHMPSGGIIFSDGITDDFLEFNSGARASITLAEKQTRLVMA